MTDGAPQGATSDGDRQARPDPPSEEGVARMGALSPGEQRAVWRDPGHPDHAAYQEWARRQSEQKRQERPGRRRGIVVPAQIDREFHADLAQQRQVSASSLMDSGAAARAERKREREEDAQERKKERRTSWWQLVVGALLSVVLGAVVSNLDRIGSVLGQAWQWVLELVS